MWSWGFQMAAKKYTPSVFLQLFYGPNASGDASAVFGWELSPEETANATIVDISNTNTAVWNFDIETIVYDGDTIMNGINTKGEQMPITVNLDSTTPFIVFDTDTYA